MIVIDASSSSTERGFAAGWLFFSEVFTSTISEDHGSSSRTIESVSAFSVCSCGITSASKISASRISGSSSTFTGLTTVTSSTDGSDFGKSFPSAFAMSLSIASSMLISSFDTGCSGRATSASTTSPSTPFSSSRYNSPAGLSPLKSNLSIKSAFFPETNTPASLHNSRNSVTFSFERLWRSNPSSSTMSNTLSANGWLSTPSAFCYAEPLLFRCFFVYRGLIST